MTPLGSRAISTQLPLGLLLWLLRHTALRISNAGMPL